MVGLVDARPFAIIFQNMLIISQRNPLWSSRRLGASQLTCGKFGCTTTSCSMLSSYFGCYRSPLELASDANNYTKEGLILWTHLNFDKMKFSWRGYARDDSKIQEAIKNPNKAVMLQVNDGAHWVVALSKTWFGNSYTVADPWDATKCDVIKKYNNITGFAIFERK